MRSYKKSPHGMSQGGGYNTFEDTNQSRNDSMDYLNGGAPSG